jgi:Flp pilus assembly protein TadD
MGRRRDSNVFVVVKISVSGPISDTDATVGYAELHLASGDYVRAEEVIRLAFSTCPTHPRLVTTRPHSHLTHHEVGRQ